MAGAEDGLTEAEHAALETSRAPPLLVARWMSDVLAREAHAGKLSDLRIQLLDDNITRMVDYWGGAERILETPVPFAYAHHIKAFLTLWVFSVPFSLLGTMGWWTPIGSAVIAFGVFGIEEIGIEIEDPFGYDPNDLPMEGIGDTISADVRQTLELSEERKVA